MEPARLEQLMYVLNLELLVLGGKRNSAKSAINLSAPKSWVHNAAHGFFFFCADPHT
jgi:hypothetical protein